LTQLRNQILADGGPAIRDTGRGDLALLYRTKPKMDLGYLIQAESDAYSIADDRHAYERGCDYRVLYKFGESDYSK
jgi:hypothetical protein